MNFFPLRMILNKIGMTLDMLRYVQDNELNKLESSFNPS